MFILYAVVIGLVVGALLGGRTAGLSEIKLRWGWVFLAGLAIQLVLFSDAVTERIGELGVPIYVGSTLAVALVVAANYRITGMPIVALGAFSNLAAVVANGGFQPPTPHEPPAPGQTPQTALSENRGVPESPPPWPA